MNDLISRQAAIERFDYIRPRDPMTSDYTHGIDVGIALCKVAIREQPPAQLGTDLAEVGTDCISRQQAVDALRKMQTYKLFSGDDMLLIDQAGAQTELMLLPPAQPEPKMGKRKRHYCEDGNPDGWQCDKCKEWYYFGQTLPNFCPNCGAKMEVNHESN